MKSYDEMAQSVLHRAKAHRLAVRRRGIAATAAVLCLCSVSLIGLAKAKSGRQEPPVLQVTQTPTTPNSTATLPVEDEPEPQAGNRVTLLHAVVGGEAVELEENVKLPYRTLIHIRDITGVTDEQMPEIQAQEQEYIDQIYACYSKENRAIGSYRGENVLITTISVGNFIFRMEDADQVESLRVSVTETGYMGLVQRLDDYCSIALRNLSIELDAEGIQQANENGIVMQWGISPQTANLLKNDPSLALSSLKDTVTITVTFKDGTVQTHIIEMVFDDNGEVYAIYRGVTTAV